MRRNYGNENKNKGESVVLLPCGVARLGSRQKDDALFPKKNYNQHQDYLFHPLHCGDGSSKTTIRKRAPFTTNECIQECNIQKFQPTLHTHGPCHLDMKSGVMIEEIV